MQKSAYASLLPTRRGFLGGATAPVATRAFPSFASEAAVEIHNLKPGDFTWHPERSANGAVAVIVSIPEQLAHVYRNGVRIGVSTCSTGKKGHETPTGVFTVLQKDKHHRSSTYNNAPMPNMNRLTWDGIALHAGKLPGYPASHGCVRLPLEFSAKLFEVTHVGTPVIVAGSHTDPWELIHPGLVLGVHSEEEMEAAVDALNAKSHPDDWTSDSAYPIATVLATSADRRLVLIENGVEILEDELVIEGPATLGEHVFLLRGSDSEKSKLHWVGFTHHHDPAQPLKAEEAVLLRLRAPEAFKTALHERLHPGMTFIVSDLAATPDRRSGSDFVIMTTEG
jgi:hypothetical protein